MTVEQLAYLRNPDTIRANLINMGGPRLSIAEIKRRLSKLPSKVEGSHIGEPTDSDGVDYRVQGLVHVERVRRGTHVITPEERAHIARLAQGIKDRPRPTKVNSSAFRYKRAKPEHTSTAFADGIVDRVCNALGIPGDVFFSTSRQKYIVAARSVVVRILRERNPAVYSYPRIAEIVGRNDHSTMIHSFQQFEHYCRLYPIMAQVYEELRGEGE